MFCFCQGVQKLLLNRRPIIHQSIGKFFQGFVSAPFLQSTRFSSAARPVQLLKQVPRIGLVGLEIHIPSRNRRLKFLIETKQQWSMEHSTPCFQCSSKRKSLRPMSHDHPLTWSLRREPDSAWIQNACADLVQVTQERLHEGQWKVLDVLLDNRPFLLLPAHGHPCHEAEKRWPLLLQHVAALRKVHAGRACHMQVAWFRLGVTLAVAV